jgi:formylglycine-generating enzyme required for sulfatase activity
VAEERLKLNLERTQSRVLRGGGWGLTALLARVAYRGRDDPGDRYVDLGFRLVRSNVEEPCRKN